MHYSTVEINIDMDTGKRRFTVSPIMAEIFMTLGDGKIHTVSEVIKTEHAAHLFSLIHPKVKLVHKNPNVPRILPGDKIKLNFKHTGPRHQRVQLLGYKAPDEPKEQEHIQVARKQSIEAAVVRIMKARKAINHNELVTETIAMCRFDPLPADIKVAIQSLIEKDYINRGEQRSQYVYVA